MKNNRLVYILIVALIIWCVVLTTSISNKTETTNEVVNEYNVSGISTDFTKIVDDHKDCIVSIDSNGTISTGFLYKQVDNSVYVITSYHGVSQSSDNKVIFVNGFNSNAQVAGYDTYLDLAVLKVDIPYNVNVLSFGDTSLTKAGEFVINIGTPNSLEFENSVELGMISSGVKTIQNSITVEKENVNYCLDVIQISSNLKTGFSGSPVINMNGEVIGMITMSSSNGYNLAIIANEMKIVADSIIDGNSIKRNNIGIVGSYIIDMPSYEKSYLNLPIEVIDGLFVENVVENSISSNAGVKSGDVIVSINGVAMNGLNNYLNIRYSDFDSYEFVVARDGETTTLKFELND